MLPSPRTLTTHTYFTSTRSLCAACYAPLDAKVLVRDGAVWLRRRCPSHGIQEVCVATSSQWFAEMLSRPSAVDPPSAPHPVVHGCPADCGPCAAHLGAFRQVAVAPGTLASAPPLAPDVAWWEVVGPHPLPTELRAPAPRCDGARDTLQHDGPLAPRTSGSSMLLTVDDLARGVDTSAASRVVLMLDGRDGRQSLGDDDELLREPLAARATALDGLLVRLSSAHDPECAVAVAETGRVGADLDVARTGLVETLAAQLMPVLRLLEALPSLDVIELRLEPEAGTLLPLDVPIALDALATASGGRLSVVDFAPAPGAHAMCFAQAVVERMGDGSGCLIVVHAWMAPDRIDLGRLMRCPHGVLVDGVRVAPHCLPQAALRPSTGPTAEAAPHGTQGQPV